MQTANNPFNPNLNTYTDKQTVNDHDNCFNSHLNTVTCTKNPIWLFKNILNHGITAPPLTFRVLKAIFCSDLDSTSGTSKSKQTHVVTEHMTHQLWASTNYQFSSVMLQNLYGQTAKELLFLNITKGAIFNPFFHMNTDAEKIDHFSVSKSDMMARFFRTLSRTARFIQKHAKVLHTKLKCIFMIKQTINNTDYNHGYL